MVQKIIKIFIITSRAHNKFLKKVPSVPQSLQPAAADVTNSNNTMYNFINLL